MSIINDALKKTQSNLSQISRRTQNALSGENQPVSLGQGVANKDTLLWGVGAAIVLGLILCITLLLSANRQTTASSRPQSPAAPTANQQLLKMVTQKPAAKAKPGELILNGIITSDNDQMALINNQILKAGDYIDDKRVLSISTDKVEIFDNGQVITLTTKKN